MPSAAPPPTPASTSSKTSVRAQAPSGAARQVFSASAMREISPPEATFSSGRGSSPRLGETRNRTASAPAGPPAARRRSRCGTRVRSMASGASSASTRFSSRRAACLRRCARAARPRFDTARGQRASAPCAALPCARRRSPRRRSAPAPPPGTSSTCLDGRAVLALQLIERGQARSRSLPAAPGLASRRDR